MFITFISVREHNWQLYLLLKNNSDISYIRSFTFLCCWFFFFNITCNCCEIGLPKTRLAVFDIPFEKFRIIPSEPKIFDRSDAIVFRPDGMSNRKKIYLLLCACPRLNFLTFIALLCYVGISENILWSSLVELLRRVLIHLFRSTKFEVTG